MNPRFSSTIRQLLLASLIGPAALTSASLVGCKPDLIPGTNVEATEENRKVLDLLGKYRDAVMQRSADQVMGLVTQDYFEDNGTPDQTDDYGAAQLREKLDASFSRTKEIQLEIIVQQIEWPEGEDGPARVAFRYNQRALVDFPAGQKWITVTDVNRLVLRPDPAAGFLIASGL